MQHCIILEVIFVFQSQAEVREYQIRNVSAALIRLVVPLHMHYVSALNYVTEHCFLHQMLY